MNNKKIHHQNSIEDSKSGLTYHYRDYCEQNDLEFDLEYLERILDEERDELLLKSAEAENGDD